MDALRARGEKVGVLKVRLYRPFSDRRVPRGAAARPSRAIAVLDRTKEPGALGEPLYLDVVAALAEARAGRRLRPMHCRRGDRRAVRARRRRSSRRRWWRRCSTSSAKPTPKRHFTVGIVDDVTTPSLPCDPIVHDRAGRVVRAVFYGLGSDGTVGANKNSIKIIGENTDLYAQGYFVYDSKKSGAITVSHLRFSPRPIRSTYLIDRADFVACHQFELAGEDRRARGRRRRARRSC